MILVLLALACCTTTSKDHYHWGDYEDIIYEMYLEPGANSINDQINRLEEDLDIAKATGNSIPPGFHAHLAVCVHWVRRKIITM